MKTLAVCAPILVVWSVALVPRAAAQGTGFLVSVVVAEALVTAVAVAITMASYHLESDALVTRLMGVRVRRILYREIYSVERMAAGRVTYIRIVHEGGVLTMLRIGREGAFTRQLRAYMVEAKNQSDHV